MTLNALECAIALGSLFAFVFALFMRIEHRLTKIETKLDLHLEHDATRNQGQDPPL